MTKTYFGKTRLITFLGILSLVLTGLFNIETLSQQTTSNSIGLYFPYVQKDGIRQPTTRISRNHYQFNGELSRESEIRYAWKGVDLDLKYKANPVRGGGFLKIFKNDDSIPENLILEYGSSPLPVNLLADSLSNGENNLLFVYVNSLSPNQSDTKVLFTFNFQGNNEQPPEENKQEPSLEAISPDPGSIFYGGVEKEIVLKVDNFNIQEGESEDQNTGKVNVYYNKVDKANFLGTFSNSITEGEATLVKISSNELKMDSIPDSEENKLIFSLVNPNGDPLNINAELPIKTNYGNSLDLGTPAINIVNPTETENIPTVNGDFRFILDVKNFNLLKEEENNAENEPNTGFIQVRIDGALVNKENEFTETSFTLNDFGIDLSELDKAEIEVKLVNKDYTDLEPPVKDTVTVNVEAEEEGQENIGTVENNNWRIIIVIITVVLVIGGISILITKG
jgi:hypothetical protein